MQAYHDKAFLDSLNEAEFQLTMQSVYWHSIDRFAADLLTRWTTDQDTKEKLDSADFHREAWQAILKREDLLMVVARNHGKSTAVSRIMILWLLLFKVHPSIILVASKGLGETIIGDIKRELEINDELRLIFGQLVPRESGAESSQKWRQRLLQLGNGTQIQTLTKGEPVRGLRPTLILIDDPQERSDVKNPQVAAEFDNWVWTSLYPTLESGGVMVVLATLISPICFANKLKAQAAERKFRLLEYPAILNFNETEWTGTPLWPQKWSMEKLKARYEKIGRREFMQEYQNQPAILNGAPVFDPAYKFKVMEPIETTKDGICFYRPLLDQSDPANVKKLYKGFLGIDLASGNIDGDYSVIQVRDVEHHLLAEYRGHCAQDRLAELTDIMVGYLEDYMIVPENNFGLAYLDACKKYKWHRKIYRQKTIDKVTNKTSDILGYNTNAKTKPLMINHLDQLFRLGDYEVSKEELDEILHFYYDEKGGMNALAPWHDDVLISNCLAVQGIKRGVNSGPLLTFL